MSIKADEKIIAYSKWLTIELMALQVLPEDRAADEFIVFLRTCVDDREKAQGLACLLGFALVVVGSQEGI